MRVVVAVVFLAALLAWAVVSPLMEHNDVFGVAGKSPIALTVRVTHHAVERAKQRYGDTSSAEQVAADVLTAIQIGTTGREAMKASGYVKTVKGTAEYAWTAGRDRLYVMKRKQAHTAVTVITALPAPMQSQSLDTPSAIRAAMNKALAGAA